MNSKIQTAMKKYIYTIVAVAAMFVSCSQETEFNDTDNTDSKAITTIGASTGIPSRAVVSSEDNTKVYWEEGDQLGVFGTNSSSEAKNLAYTLVGSGSGTTSGTFKNASSDITAISAIMYPYQENATCANNIITCEIPSVQTATTGSFDKAAAIMYSIGDATGVALNYAVNFLKVTISDSEPNVHSISISSTATVLSGKIEIASGSVTVVSDSLKSVVLTAGKGKVFATGDYYIAVKAGNIENPTISYVYYNDDHTATEKTKAGSGTLSFADGKNVKPVSVTDWTGATERKAIQLWTDGPYFAECNIGAGKPESSGTYFAWGETQPVSVYNLVFDWPTYEYSNEKGKLTKYCTNSDYGLNGFIDGKTTLEPCDDAAFVNWNGNWRMPTAAEFQELKDSCTWTWDSLWKGFKVTGNDERYTNNSIFLLAGGYYQLDLGLRSLYGLGYYWSSSRGGRFDTDASAFNFTQGGSKDNSDQPRCYALSVRAVCQ